MKKRKEHVFKATIKKNVNSFVFVSYFNIQLNVCSTFITGESAFISPCSLLLC